MCNQREQLARHDDDDANCQWVLTAGSLSIFSSHANMRTDSWTIREALAKPTAE